MQTKNFKKGEKGKNESISILFLLPSFLFLILISSSIIGCGGDGGGGVPFSTPGDDGDIIANMDPVADFTVNRNLGVASFTDFYFDAGVSDDPDGEITSYEWDFDNDGNTDWVAPTATASWTYDTPGQKTALLRVTDDKGGVDEIRKDMVVLPSWEVTNGPFSGTVSSLTTDPTDSGVVYSITQKSEVYQRTDGGLRWTYFPTKDTETQDNIRVRVLEIAPNDDNQVFYLGTHSQGMYKSTDGGETWAHISNGLPEDDYGYLLSVEQIVIDPNDPEKLYIRLNLGYRIYKTVDGGQNWSEIWNGEAVLNTVQDMAIDPTDYQKVYIGTWTTGVWKSKDGGSIWDHKSVGLGDNTVTEVAIDNEDPDMIYAGTFDMGLYRTDDAGESWGYLWIYRPANYQEIVSLEVDPNNPSIIYVGMNDTEDDTNDGLWVTTDYGWNWDPYFPGNDDVLDIRIAPSNSEAFVKVFSDTWYKRSNPSEDEEWQQVNFDGILDLRVSALSNVLPEDRSFIYAGTKLGVYRTTDGGDTWEVKSQGLGDPYIYALVMDPNDTQRVYVGTRDGVYVTTDGGENWVQKNNGLTNTKVYALAMDGNILYAGTRRGVFKTTDSGENWVEKSEGLPFTCNSVWNLVLTLSNNLVLYASVIDDCGPWQEKIYRSIDGADSWADASGELPNDRRVGGMVVPFTDSNVVYTGINGYGVYKTVDGGATWELKDSGLTSTNVISLSISQQYDQMVFAGTEDKGVFATIDGGENWIQIDQGLTSDLNKEVCSLVMDLMDFDNPVMYAGTGCGVFKAYK